MAYRLRMPAQIGDWLAELQGSERVAAAEVGAAIVALINAAELPGPPLVTDLARQEDVDPADRVIAVDAANQEVRSSLQLLRQAAASAGAEAEGNIAVALLTPAGVEPLPEDEIRRSRAAAQRHAQQLTARLERGQREAAVFGARIEGAKARYAAAMATRDVGRAFVEAAGQAQPGLADAAAELTASAETLTEVAAELAELLVDGTRIRRMLLSDFAGDDVAKVDPAVPGLLELRAYPLGSDIRILFAVEPTATVTLLAALEGEAAINEHRASAIGLAGKLLEEIRGRGWAADDDTETAGPEFADAATFLRKYFPDLDITIVRRAVTLAAARTLTSLRRQRGLSLADLSELTGMPARDLWQLEVRDVRNARLSDLAAYVHALGGRLDLVADIGGDQRRLS